MPLPKDPIKAEESRRKMSEAAKKRMADPEIRRKVSDANTGKIQSPETIAKRVAKITGQQRSPRTKKNCTYCGKELILTEWEKNRKFCSMECKGKWQSENAVGEKGMNWHGGNITKKCEVCGKDFEIEKTRKDTARFCSFSCKGVWMSENLSGENNPSYGKLSKIAGANHPQWTGGPKEYCEKWTSGFRRRIRTFFDNRCVECGTQQGKEKLHCHHVYYDKKACCAVNENGTYLSNLGITGNPHSFIIVGDPNKFVTLCRSCHAKTTAKRKREYWARHFEEIINHYYQGNSYLTKEEFEKIK